MEDKRYLKIFSSQSDYESQKDSVMGMPHVVLFEDTNELLYASESETPNDPFNGHEYVDLGLPSGTLWASSPLTSSEGEALYFQWGETEGYTETQINNGEQEFTCDGSDYKWMENGSFTKYNETDGKVVLDLEDDAAHVHMGGDWHMPTKEQWEELTANTTSIWTTQNGVSGRLFTSTINGKSVFVPAFGGASDGAVYGFGSYAFFWSSSLYSGSVASAWGLLFSSGNLCVSNDGRPCGYCVLGVVG